MTWMWLMGVGAFIGAAFLSGYVLGFVHGRRVEREYWSPEWRGLQELRRRPRVMNP